MLEARIETLNPEIGLPKPESTPPGARPEFALRDLRIRLIMIPVFGVMVPLLTGLFGSLGPRDFRYWLGYLWFTALSFLIWQGNRWVLLAQRRRLDWFEQPVRKIILLVLANVLYTAPLSVAMLWLWYRGLGVAADWGAIRAATLMSVICVLFITHVYETVYLIQQRESDLVRVEQTERARAEAELEALKAQVDPHFLFNSLNTLAWLIDHDAAQARRFNENLAEVYRYILHNKGRSLVLAEEELMFLTRYCELLRLRFGEAVEWDFPSAASLEGLLLPPISLQILAENSVKHNEVSRDHPLLIRLESSERGLTMRNERRPRTGVRESGRIGLRNLDERCRLILGRGIEVSETPQEFRVTLPVERLA